ncbi:hypothetical protein OIHEL45_16686 [Sulfitobacter indolifex HEL-45]|uniref:Uncharacterized protein n=1 Tax=Sulfitobacter indolifex HEL-45 TaxID=391624 RepID=A0ABM9X0Z9_9RHOB|nr:hypothetical protein OIHEL45_16686 [Sulfitobacter indolifex HEL-45]
MIFLSASPGFDDKTRMLMVEAGKTQQVINAVDAGALT